MRSVFAVVAVLSVLCLCVAAQAVVMETVAVGNAGNAADTRYGIHGSVAYNYNIGKYEVTTVQYTEFLNAKARTDAYGLWNASMANTGTVPEGYGCNIQRSGASGSYTYTVGSGSSADVAAWGNRPVNYVSFWDACRFVNWLDNGEGNGDTETGAYTLGGYIGSDGRAIQRNAGRQWAVTSDDEWYKAAYYKGGGTDAGYWDYATQSDIVPIAAGPTGSANRANYNFECTGTTRVGAYTGSASAYGTFDQNGNVWEWDESLPYISYASPSRGARGGSFTYYGDGYLRASDSVGWFPSSEYNALGFRVSQTAPEPSSVIALAGGVISLFAIRRRRA